MNVSGSTRVTGLFGYPVEHTLSPAMHNAAFEYLGLDICYIPFKVSPDDLPDAVRSVRSLNMLGINTTVPHKEKVIPLLDNIDEEAEFIGAVNTITNKEGLLTGYNTDGRGFMQSLSEEGISLDGKKVVIIGAGGASRAISYYISEKAADLSMYDIDTSRAQNLVNDLNKIRGNVQLLDDTEQMGMPDIIINATPLGLKQDDPLPLNPDIITPAMSVCDLVYRQTAFLKSAQARGAKTVNGSGMLLWQGIFAFQLWTGIKPPVELMRKELLSRIS